MRLVPALLLILLAACGRPLTPNEMAFMATLQGDQFDPAEVRLHDGLARQRPREIPVPPRLTCQQRIYPPLKGDTVAVATGAMALFGSVHVRGDLYAPDFMAGYPERMTLVDAMLFAHEMVHVWQWQNRDRTGYHPLRAAFEHVANADPYLFNPDTSGRFLDYGFEQQGAILEEYVCCRTLAPEAPRTARLHALLSQELPLTPLDRPLAPAVQLPWDGVQIAGICD